MTITIDKDKVLILLERAVEQKGADYIDPRSKNGAGCKYVDDEGNPSCIVGHVVSYLKPELIPIIATWEKTEYPEKPVTENGYTYYDYENPNPVLTDGYVGEPVASELARALSASDEIVFTDEAIEVLLEAQVYQDAGNSWGAALQSARD